METLESEPQVLADGKGVAFALLMRNVAIECAVSAAALQTHFWLESNASDARILKTFRDGFPRIRAVAERKLLARPASRLELTPDDFARL